MPRPRYESPSKVLALFANINFESPTAVYAQIENLVRFGVSSGKLKVGDQIPSVRELSERLKVNANTVVKAYRDLEVTGVVTTRRGMGVYIRDGAEKICARDSRNRVLQRLLEVVAEGKASGMTSAELKRAFNSSLTKAIDPYATPPRDAAKLLA